MFINFKDSVLYEIQKNLLISLPILFPLFLGSADECLAIKVKPAKDRSAQAGSSQISTQQPVDLRLASLNQKVTELICSLMDHFATFNHNQQFVNWYLVYPMIETIFPANLRMRRSADFDAIVQQATLRARLQGRNVDVVVFEKLIEWLTGINTTKLKKGIDPKTHYQMLLLSALQLHCTHDSLLAADTDGVVGEVDELHPNYFLFIVVKRMMNQLSDFNQDIPVLHLSILDVENIISSQQQSLLNIAITSGWFAALQPESDLQFVIDSILAVAESPLSLYISPDSDIGEAGSEQALQRLLSPAYSGESIGNYLQRIYHRHSNKAAILIALLMLRLNLEQFEGEEDSTKGTSLYGMRQALAYQMFRLWKNTSSNEEKLNLINFFTTVLNISFIGALMSGGNQAAAGEVIDFINNLPSEQLQTTTGAMPSGMGAQVGAQGMGAQGMGASVVNIVNYSDSGPIQLDPSLGAGALVQTLAAVGMSGQSGTVGGNVGSLFPVASTVSPTPTLPRGADNQLRSTPTESPRATSSRYVSSPTNAHSGAYDLPTLEPFTPSSETLSPDDMADIMDDINGISERWRPLAKSS